MTLVLQGGSLRNLQLQSLAAQNQVNLPRGRETGAGGYDLMRTDAVTSGRPGCPVARRNGLLSGRLPNLLGHPGLVVQASLGYAPCPRHQWVVPISHHSPENQARENGTTPVAN